MKITVELPNDVKNTLYHQAIAEVKSGITEKAIMEYMSENNSPCVKDLLRSFNISRRYQEIVDKKTTVGDLSSNDKLICLLYWMMYEELGRC